MPWIMLALGGLMLVAGTNSARDIRLTRNFRLSEWAVSSSFPHLAILPTNRQVIARIRAVATYLQILRDELSRRFGYEVSIALTSGWRSRMLNAAIPGASDSSDHMTGWGADIKASGWTNHQLIQVLWELVEAGQIPIPDQVITYDDGRGHLHVSWASAARGQWKVKNSGAGYRTWRAA